MPPPVLMKRLIRGLVLISLFVLLTALCATAFALYEPVSASSSVDPKALTGPQTVTVTIRVVNSGDGDIPDAITLYDPAGNRVKQWDSMKLGGSDVYTGTWDVTDAELKEGKIKYRLSFTAYDDDGVGQGTSKTVAVDISRASANAKLTGDYSISPTMANPGQTVTFTYTLSNTGNVDVTEVQINNPSVTDQKLNVGSIAAGDRKTVTQDITMGNTALKSKPSATYKANGTVLTLTNLPEKTVEVAQGGLTVNVAAEGKTEVMPGEKVDLTITVENKGNLTYNNLTVTEASLGDVVPSMDLKAGDKEIVPRSIVINESASYTFVATAQDSTGQTVTVESNTIQVIAVDTTQMLQMEVSVESDASYITERGEIVTFRIRIANTGESDGTGIVVRNGTAKEGAVTTLPTIASVAELPAGEEITLVKEFELSYEGTYVFTVTGTGGQGVTSTATSNELVIPLIVPTPEPPPTPEPVVTAPPPEPSPTPEPETGLFGGSWLMYAGLALLVLLLVLLVLWILLRRRDRGGGGGPGNPNTVDSLEMGTHRNYTGAARRKQGGDRDRKGEPQDDEDPEVSLYDQALYGSERDLPDAAALARAQAEAMNDPEVYESLYGRPEGQRGKSRRPADEEDALDEERAKSRRRTQEVLDALDAQEDLSAPGWPDLEEGQGVEPSARHRAAEEPEDEALAGYRPLRQETGHYRLPKQGKGEEPEEGSEEDSSSTRSAGRRRRRSESPTQDDE